MASGLPVVASNIGQNKYIVSKETGFLVNVRSANELSKKIEHLLEDSVLGSKIGLNSYGLVKKMSWSEMALKFSEVYESFLKK